MAPLLPILVSPLLILSSSSHDSTTASGPSFGTALLIALAGMLAFVLVPLVLYFVITSLTRWCKARRQRRRRRRRQMQRQQQQRRGRGCFWNRKSKKTEDGGQGCNAGEEMQTRRAERASNASEWTLVDSTEAYEMALAPMRPVVTRAVGGAQHAEFRQGGGGGEEEEQGEEGATAATSHLTSSTATTWLFFGQKKKKDKNTTSAVQKGGQRRRRLLWSRLFLTHWKAGSKSDGKDGGDGGENKKKKETVVEQGEVEREENIVFAFLGFLGSWARIE